MKHTGLLVVGAGPAGLAAAAEAGRAGIGVLVIDENLQPGGQIYRQNPPEFRIKPSGRTDDFRKGQDLIAEARDAGVEFRFGCTAWASFESGIMEVIDASGPDRIHAQRTILANGAYDRPVPVPGWTLPGVFTVGGAQALLKGQRILPGRRVLLAGVGPLLLVVASQLSKAGAHVVAVAEPTSWWAAGTILPALAREWPLLRDGVRCRAGLAWNRVPWLSRTALTRIEGDDRVSGAVVARVDRDWRPVAGSDRRFEVDAVAIGYGLLPSIELPRICGCAVEYDAVARSWSPVRSRVFESTVPGIFVVGDGAGVAGAIVAIEEGRSAGLTVAEQLGGRPRRSEYEGRVALHMRRIAALQRFRRAVDRAYALRGGLFEVADRRTIVCRCEEVRFEDLAEAVLDGADTLAMLKSFTRCGMGPCQGRMCAATATEWLAARTGQNPESIGVLPAAPPAKPVVTLEALASG